MKVSSYFLPFHVSYLVEKGDSVFLIGKIIVINKSMIDKILENLSAVEFSDKLATPKIMNGREKRNWG